MINTELVPNVSVGQIKLGDPIEKHLVQPYEHFPKKEDDPYMDDYYEFPDLKLALFVNSDNKIESIHCDVECFWKSKNLIGLRIDEFITLAGMQPIGKEKIYVVTGYNKGQNQDVYDFEDLGLQVWAWRNKIVMVICTKYDEE